MHMKKNGAKSLLIWLIIIAIMVVSVSALLKESDATEIIYSEVLKKFQEGSIKEFDISADGVLMMKDESGLLFSHELRDVSIFREDLGDLILAQMQDGTLTRFDYASLTVSIWVQLLPYLIVIVLFALMWWFFIAKTSKGGTGGGLGGRMNSFSRARTKLGSDEKKKIYFRDVAGVDEEKAELQEIVEFLREPKKFSDLGARIPKGVLLIGPPGTGKTMLAKAVAGESGVPFYSISGSDFLEMYVGVGAARVRDLFETAKKSAPCIIFIDEIDAVGRHRGAGWGGGHDEREQTLNQLLVEMDGFGAFDGVIVMAATNRPDILDPALMRPGRFDRQVTVNLPDLKGRAAILRVHSKKKPLGEDVNLDEVAKSTVGMTGADLENVLNEAALLAARRKKTVINMPDIEDAILKVMVGPQKRSLIISDEDKKNTAYHEAGHAIVGHLLPTQDPVHHISIIPSGRALGYTLSFPQSDKTTVFRTEMKERIAVLLAGRVAEQLTFGDFSGGASNDIERASEIARKMVTRYGMSDELGPIAYGKNNDEVFLGLDYNHTKDYSEEIAAKIDSEVHKIISEGYALAERILKENSSILSFVADYLVKHETMDADQFLLCFEENVTEEQLDAVADKKKQANIVENEARRVAKEKKKADRETPSEGKKTVDDDFS